MSSLICNCAGNLTAENTGLMSRKEHRKLVRKAYLIGRQAELERNVGLLDKLFQNAPMRGDTALIDLRQKIIKGKKI
jgi:hypothetical protein